MVLSRFQGHEGPMGQGYGQAESGVVIGVLTNQVDPAGSAPDPGGLLAVDPAEERYRPFRPLAGLSPAPCLHKPYLTHDAPLNLRCTGLSVGLDTVGGSAPTESPSAPSTLTRVRLLPYVHRAELAETTGDQLGCGIGDPGGHTGFGTGKILDFVHSPAEGEEL